MRFRKKPVVIEAITFDELVAHGLANTENVHDGLPWSFQYAGHGVTHENENCYLIPTLEGTMRFERGDMLITGIKGEIYPCRGDIFAATYDSVHDSDCSTNNRGTPEMLGPCDCAAAEAVPIEETYSLSFGLAIEALQLGKRVARAGWNGKGMWLVLDPGSFVSEVREGSAYHKAGVTGSFAINPHIDMKTATGEMQPGWLASQTDMLADDWAVI